MMNRLYLQTSRRLATAILTQRYTAAALLSHALPSTTTVSSYPSPADIQLQRRYMVSKKKDKGKKGGGGNKNNKITTKLFEPIWHLSDIEVDDSDAIESFKDLNDLQKKCNEYYGWEKKDLEMMDNNDNWKKLTNDELKKFNGKIVKVRDKEIYSEEEEEDYGSDEDYDEYGYNPDDDDDDEYGYNPKKDACSRPPMRECIDKLIAELKLNDYERVVDAKALQKGSTGETILTKEYILKKASDDEELLSLLVDNIGAIDHVIHWIHVDSVWNNVKIEEDPCKDVL